MTSRTEFTREDFQMLYRLIEEQLEHENRYSEFDAIDLEFLRDKLRAYEQGRETR